MWKFQLYILTRPKTLRMARTLVRRAVEAKGASERDALDIEVAVGEILTNAYVHAYNRGVGPLDLRIAFDGERFMIEVRDHGKGITSIPRMSPPSGPGLGLQVARRLMDEFEILRPERRGTAVRMVKRLLKSPRATEPQETPKPLP